MTMVSSKGVKTAISAIDGRLGLLESEDADEFGCALEAMGQIGSSNQGAALLLSGSPPAARHVVNSAFDQHGRGKQLMNANNEDTSRANVFIKTRSKKDGTIPDNDTRNLVERMNEKLNEVPIEEQTEGYKEQIFVDLVGPNGHGRVRTFGLGPSPRDVFGTRSSSTTTHSSSDEIEKMVDAKVAQKIAQFEKNQMEMFQKTQMEMLEKIAQMQRLLEVHGILSSGFGSSVGQAWINSPMDD